VIVDWSCIGIFDGANDEEFIWDLVKVFANGAKTNSKGSRCAPASSVAVGLKNGEERRQESEA
jgi:hypothetical protein